MTGTGNEADKRHHYQGETSGQKEREMVELRVGPGVRGFQAEIWTDIPDVLAVSLYSPSGEQIQKFRSVRTVEMNTVFFWNRQQLL